MSNLIPVEMTYEELAALLTDMALRVRAGDSFEGNIEYLMPGPVMCPDCKGTGVTGGPGGYYDAPGKGKPCGSCDGSGDIGTAGPDDKVLVRGVYRIGNSEGQGGMRMIGSVPT